MQSISSIRTIETLRDENEVDILNTYRRIVNAERYGLGKGMCTKRHLMFHRVMENRDCDVFERIKTLLVPTYKEHEDNTYSVAKKILTTNCGCGGQGCGECTILGGAEGQVLVKSSGEDGDYTWLDVEDILDGATLQDLNSVVLEGNWTTLGMTGTEFFEDKEDEDFVQGGDVTIRTGDMEW